MHSVYAELLGAAFLYSAKYELRPVRPLGLRLGASVLPCDDGVCAIVVASSLHVLMLRGPHSPEFGFGTSVAFNDEESTIFYYPMVGYRHIAEDGFMFRILFTPLYGTQKVNDSNVVLPGGGISMGYAW